MKGSAFNQLLVFHAIARAGGIRGAARALELSVPSVSQSLKQLETSLGLPLFNRTTRRIELTDAGERLRTLTAEPMHALDHAFESVRDLTERPSGRVAITLPRFVYQHFLRPIYADFCRSYPDIQLEISISDATVDLLREGLDLGIRFGDRIEQGMVARPLSPPMQEALFASEDYIARHGLPTSPDDLPNHRLVHYRFIASNQLAPLQLMHGRKTLTVQMPVALVVNDTDAMIDAAESGLGIGRIVVPMVRKHFDAGRLRPILEPFWCRYPGLFLYFPKDSQRARRVRVFVDYLVEKARDVYGTP